MNAIDARDGLARHCGPRGASRSGSTVGIASLLDLDPELGAGIASGAWQAARGRALVRLQNVGKGEWKAQAADGQAAPGAALLLVNGLLAREIEIDGRGAAELLGPGDVAFPWEADRLPGERWRALTPTRVAVLDRPLMARLAPWPSITLALAARSTQRGRVLAALALTRQLRRVDQRLTLLFSLLAERWGTIAPDGIHLRLPIAHELLGHMVGARRQSVTTALGELRARGVLAPLPGGEWLLAPTGLPAQAARPPSASRRHGPAARVPAPLGHSAAGQALASPAAGARASWPPDHGPGRACVLARGIWDALAEFGEHSSWLGLLILDGFIARQTRSAAGSTLDLLGPGDLLRPWDHRDERLLTGITTGWKVLEPARVALLDERFAQTSLRSDLTIAILARTGRRARSLAVLLAISRLPHVPARIFCLFCHLALRWGRSRGDGIVIPLRLTHEEIAQLIGARRPSVTTALGQLRDEGLLLRVPGGGWQLPAGAGGSCARGRGTPAGEARRPGHRARQRSHARASDQTAKRSASAARSSTPRPGRSSAG